MLRKWRERRGQKRGQREVVEAIVDVCETSWHGIDVISPPGDPEIVRRLSDESLHGWLGRDDLAGAARIAMERELRQREAWLAPAGRAVKISAWALGVSVLALIVSAVALWLRNSN